ncbi:PilN domain-containing protein [Candidatus Thiosymbion oneisti]|uniref:PilN domain-containing protein n=1 Tax=Candidatus Thiosymbion oneisti TaxID=589554 RepID=UPI000A50B8D4|nr:PilN domain-containing protein [Candidatus Thiosymbion oneisti]
MVRINLLPWRELKRRRRRREFAAIAATGLTATLTLGLVLHLNLEGLISGQQDRNRFLRNEIGQLDGQIREIRGLEKTKERLLGRMYAIHRLQMSRPEMVHLFDELTTGTPEGIHLTRISQSGRSIVLEGRARSDAQVSAFVRNIEASQWIGKPALLLIEHRDKTGTGLSRFRLRFEQLAEAGREAEET